MIAGPCVSCGKPIWWCACPGMDYRRPSAATMTDPVAALAGKLLPKVLLISCSLESEEEIAAILAREALAFARAQMPTRAEVSESIVRSFLPYGVVYDSSDEDYRDMADLVWKAADALLRDLTARLGGEEAAR